MAQGTITVFDQAKLNIANNLLNLSAGTDFRLSLITTLPTAVQTTPDSADFTECTVGGNYAGPVTLTSTLAESGGTVTFSAGDPAEWLAAAGSPIDIKSALIYSNTAVGEDALAFIDLTADGGTTPISMVDGKLAISLPAGILTIA